MPRTRLFAYLAAVIVAATACGPTAGGSPGETIASAAAQTIEAGTARVYLSISSQLAAASGQSFELNGKGAFDFENQRGRMRFDLSKLMAPANLDAGEETEMIFDELVVYMKFPGLSQLIPGGKPWVKIDLEAAGNEAGVNLSQLRQFGQNDPTQSLQYLHGAKDIEEAGQEDVRGVQTTHYKATIDLQKAVEEAPEEVRASVSQAVEIAGIEEIPANVWIDEEGLLRRVTYEYGVSAGDGGSASAATSVVTMDLFDFGAEVDADPPAEGQVTDIADLLQRQTQ